MSKFHRDEVLVMNDGTDDYYYGHDHLYSTVVIFDDAGAAYERAEEGVFHGAGAKSKNGGGEWESNPPWTLSTQLRL